MAVDTCATSMTLESLGSGGIGFAFVRPRDIRSNWGAD